MKQFLVCLLFTIFFHILASFLGGSYDPMEWGYETERERLGRGLYVLIQLFIWLIPIGINYLDGKDNF